MESKEAEEARAKEIRKHRYLAFFGLASALRGSIFVLVTLALECGVAPLCVHCFCTVLVLFVYGAFGTRLWFYARRRACVLTLVPAT